jgi:hypothetical protein
MPGVTSPDRWALWGTREHLDDWTRVRSIITSMSDALKNEITEANKTKELMETGAVGLLRLRVAGRAEGPHKLIPVANHKSHLAFR